MKTSKWSDSILIPSALSSGAIGLDASTDPQVAEIELTALKDEHVRALDALKKLRKDQGKKAPRWAKIAGMGLIVVAGAAILVFGTFGFGSLVVAVFTAGAVSAGPPLGYLAIMGLGALVGVAGDRLLHHGETPDETRGLTSHAELALRQRIVEIDRAIAEIDALERAEVPRR